MSVDQSSTEAPPPAIVRFLKRSHRTRPEQLVGLAIYLLISLGFQTLTGLTAQFLGILYSLCLALSMWTLWRRYSLRVLKLELSVFLAQFLFQAAWSFSHFALQETVLELVSLLLLWSNTLLAALLFWKKEPLSTLLLLFPLVWVFYWVGLNMVICISNP